ncbi:MAG: fibronectin type III domain-containing protein [Chloroflexi bacterium]|nr:fibronectin type III domain-containing protein [Chloroflexota bacterium]
MPGYPHVAYVTSVDPNTKNVVVLEQNGNCPGGATGGCTRSWSYSRTTYQSKGGRFIGYKGGVDSTPPDGDITSPSEGATITSRTVHLAGWAQDNSGGSGLQKAHFTAYYNNGSWRQVGPDFTSSPFEFDWDMCNDGVPDGQVTLGLDIWDKAGNAAYSPRGNRHFNKNYNCSPPPDCPQSGGLILYKHNNYNCGGEGEGSGYVIRSTTGWQNVPGSFNDQASSVRVPSGWSVRLYEHSDRGGGSICRSGDDSDFAGDTFDNGVGLNDNVSSFEVFSSPNCPSSTCNTPSPSSPCNGLRINQSSSVNFSWSGNCSQYYAEYWGGPAGTIGSGWIGSTSWNPGQLWCGNYSWHVKGKSSSAGIETGWSSTCNFTVVPNKPTGLTASAVSGSQINLSWNDPGGEKDGYKVYYSDGRYIGSTSSTSYQVTGLNCSASYCFYVKAYRSSFESDPSDTACATTQACPGTTPATPTRTATAGPPPTITPTRTPTCTPPPPGNCPRNVSGYVRNVANSVGIGGATLSLQFWSTGYWQAIDQTISKPDGFWSFYTSDCRAPWRVQVTPPPGFWADHVEPALPGHPNGNDAVVWLSATDCEYCSATFWLRGTAPTPTPSRTPTRTRTPTPMPPSSTSWKASTGFSLQQGTNQWYYQYWDGSAYRDMLVSGGRWKAPGTQWCLLWGDGGHPSTYEAARRWRSPVTGTVRITGNARKSNTGGGDGVIVSIWKNSTKLWERTLAFDDSLGHDFDLTTPVAVGDSIYFRIAQRGNDYYDGTAFDPTITLITGPSPTPSPTGGATRTPTITPTPTSTPSGIAWRASTDFSLEQGANQWYYQYWDGSTYRDMVVSGGRWKAPGTQWCLLWGDGGHPSVYEAARRWRSPVTGTVRITGNARKSNTGGGDGVTVSIWKNATKLWERTLVFNDSVGYDFDLTTQVAVGDSIYFRIAQRGNDYYDGTAFDPTITLITGPSPTPSPTGGATRTPTITPTPTSTPSGIAWRASTGFSLEQGANQWYYQYRVSSTYRYMTVSGDKWKAPGTQWCLLWGDGGHPSIYEAARRWRSPVTGTVRITGNARKSNTGGGDGVIVSIWKNATKLWERTLAFNDGVGYAFDLTTEVAVGDSIYFRIAQRGNDYYDGTAFDPTITLVSPGTSD